MWFIRPASCLCRCRCSILNYYFWNIFIRGAGPLVIHDIRIMEAIFPWLTMIACVSQWYFIQDGTETLKKTFFTYAYCIFYFIDSLSRICHILIIVRPSDFSDLSYPSSLVPGSLYVQYLMWWERYGGIKIMLWRCRIWWKSLLKLFTVCYSPHATAARGGGQQKLDTMVEFSVQNAQYADIFLYSPVHHCHPFSLSIL